MTASSGVVLSNLAYLIGAVVLAIIGGLAVWLHHRQPKSVDANVESFQRGLQAIAPDASHPGPLRAPAVSVAESARIRPRSTVTLQRTRGAGLGAAADGATSSPSDHKPLAGGLAEQSTDDRAAAGDGPGNRAEAETG
jgi:hypothetical protein